MRIPQTKLFCFPEELKQVIFPDSCQSKKMLLLRLIFFHWRMPSSGLQTDYCIHNKEINIKKQNKTKKISLGYIVKICFKNKNKTSKIKNQIQPKNQGWQDGVAWTCAVTKPDNLNLIPGTHMLEGKLSTVSHGYQGLHTSTQNKCNKNIYKT